MTARTRWLGYVRVSTDEQAAQGFGLDAQRDAIGAAIGAQGGVLIDVIEDAGVSGKDLDRPGFAAALDRLTSGEADGLIVAKLDRLSRSVIDCAELVEWFDRADLAFWPLDIGADTTTPAGRMMLNMLATVAEWERDVIAERTRTTLAAKTRRGERVSGPTVAVDAPDLHARITTLRQAGRTLQDIADTLTDEGVPTLRGGVRWYPSTVSSVLGYRAPKRKRKRIDLPDTRKRAA